MESRLPKTIRNKGSCTYTKCIFRHITSEVYEAKRQLIETNQLITAAAIKDHLLGTDQRNKMLVKIFEGYNEKVKKLIGIDYSLATWTKYNRTKRFTQLFIQSKYKEKDLPIQCLDLEFVNDLELWLKPNVSADKIIA